MHDLIPASTCPVVGKDFAWNTSDVPILWMTVKRAEIKGGEIFIRTNFLIQEAGWFLEIFPEAKTQLSTLPRVDTA